MRPAFLMRFFGRFHLLVGATFLVPLAVGLLHAESHVWAWLGPALVFIAIGVALDQTARSKEPRLEPADLRRREGFFVVAISWILMILHGAIPFLLTGSVPDISSAIFESASGFTTTGATILEDIEAQPKSILFWRSFSHWLGGMGIIVLSLAILPELAVGGMQLFSAESTGLSVEKLAPRIAQTAKRLWLLYAVLTVVEFILLWGGGMTVFDAVNHSMATTATGGFSPLQDSIGQYDSLYFETVITVFMLLAGINFALQYRAIARLEFRSVIRSTELRVYLGIFLVVTALIATNLILAEGRELGDSFRDSSFQVAAILTTTGFGTDDFNAWPTFSKFLIVILMALGGCAGSTAGGLKIIRLVVIVKHTVRECRRLIYPRLVKPVTVDGKAIDEPVLWGVLGFLALYVMSFVAVTILLCLLPHAPPVDEPGAEAMDLVTAATASLSALNSIGPGLERVGPTANFAFIHPIGKLALAFCMLLGRLEIYSLLVLFLPSFWRAR